MKNSTIKRPVIAKAVAVMFHKFFPGNACHMIPVMTRKVNPCHMVPVVPVK